MAQPVIPTLAADQALAVSTLVNDSVGRWNATSPKGTAVTVQYSFGTSVPTYVGHYATTQVSEAAAFKAQTDNAGGSGWQCSTFTIPQPEPTSVGVRLCHE